MAIGEHALNRRIWRKRVVVAVMVAVAPAAGRGWESAATAAVLEVGPGYPFERLEAAVEVASPGDEIRVHPRKGWLPYEEVALRVRTPRLRIVAIGPNHIRGRIGLNGVKNAGAADADVVRFEPGSDGSILDGFVIVGARSAQGTAAGVRVDRASGISIRTCVIHHNDRGIVSEHDETNPSQRVDALLVDQCSIHHNGGQAPGKPGQGQNLDLAGVSMTVRSCMIHTSLGSHNLRSRARFNRIECNYFRGSTGHEVDLVDSPVTEQAGSHAILLGNHIVQTSGNDPASERPRAVIHFGQDRGHDHRGTLFLVSNEIATSSTGPVLELSAPGASALLVGNRVGDLGGSDGPSGQSLVNVRDGAMRHAVSGRGNLLGRGFAETCAEGTRVLPGANEFAVGREANASLFSDPAAGRFHPPAAFQLTAAQAQRLVNASAHRVVLPADPIESR